MCVKLDTYADYIPVVSSITNLVDLFLKYVFRPCVGEAQLQNNHYFAYLDTKTWLRSITLLVPVIGNILIAIIDIYSAIRAEELQGLAAHLNRPEEAGNAVQLYNEAYFWGSVEAKYQLGSRLLSGKGLTITDPVMAKKFLRAAAALGHPRAQEALSAL